MRFLISGWRRCKFWQPCELRELFGLLLLLIVLSSGFFSAQPLKTELCCHCALTDWNSAKHLREHRFIFQEIFLCVSPSLLEVSRNSLCGSPRLECLLLQWARFWGSAWTFFPRVQFGNHLHAESLGWHGLPLCVTFLRGPVLCSLLSGAWGSSYSSSFQLCAVFLDSGSRSSVKQRCPASSFIASLLFLFLLGASFRNSFRERLSLVSFLSSWNWKVCSPETSVMIWLLNW